MMAGGIPDEGAGGIADAGSGSGENGAADTKDAGGGVAGAGGAGIADTGCGGVASGGGNAGGGGNADTGGRGIADAGGGGIVTPAGRGAQTAPAGVRRSRLRSAARWPARASASGGTAAVSGGTAPARARRTRGLECHRLRHDRRKPRDAAAVRRSRDRQNAGGAQADYQRRRSRAPPGAGVTICGGRASCAVCTGCEACEVCNVCAGCAGWRSSARPAWARASRSAPWKVIARGARVRTVLRTSFHSSAALFCRRAAKRETACEGALDVRRQLQPMRLRRRLLLLVERVLDDGPGLALAHHDAVREHSSIMTSAMA